MTDSNGNLVMPVAPMGGYGTGGMGGFGDIFSDLFGGGASRSSNSGPRRGASLRAMVHLTFEEAVFGCTKELELTLKDTCQTCVGTGAKPGTSPETCPNCHGSGQIRNLIISFKHQLKEIPFTGSKVISFRKKCDMVYRCIGIAGFR